MKLTSLPALVTLLACISVNAGDTSFSQINSADIMNKIFSAPPKDGVTVKDFIIQKQKEEGAYNALKALGLGNLGVDRGENRYEAEARAKNSEKEKILLDLAKFQAHEERTRVLFGPLKTREVAEFSLGGPVTPKAVVPAVQITKLKGQDIYYFQTLSFKEQALLFNRINFLIERPNKSVLNDYALYSGLNKLQENGYEDGEDYSTSDIAKFFNAAKEKGIKLNLYEIFLRKQLLSMSLIVEKNGKYIVQKDAAVISTPRNPKDGIATLNHELNHGIYFTDEKYRKAAFDLYKSLSASEKKVLFEAIKSGGGDESDDDLMAREFVAHFRDLPALLEGYFNPGEKSTLELMRQMSEKVLGLDKFSCYYSKICDSSDTLQNRRAN